MVEDYFLAADVGNSHRQFLTFCKKAWARACAEANIESVLSGRLVVIVLLTPRTSNSNPFDILRTKVIGGSAAVATCPPLQPVRVGAGSH